MAAAIKEAVFDYYDGAVERSHPMAYLLQLAAMPANEPVMMELRRKFFSSGSAASDPLHGRKIVDMEGPEGIRGTVVPDIPGLNLDPLDAFEDDPGQPYDGKVVDRDKKVFELHHLFSDVNVADKLGFTAKYMQFLRRMAVDQPSRAAANVQERLRSEGFPNYSVRAGRFAKSRTQASARVMMAAERTRVVAPSTAAEVADNKLFLHFTSAEGVIEWTVYGPISNAKEIMSAYRLAIAYGVYDPVFAFSLDYQILDITVWDAVKRFVVSPSVKQHVGLDGVDPEGHLMPADLSDDVKHKLKLLESCVLPVTLNDVVVGSAIRVTGKYMLANEHVINAEVDIEGDLATPGSVATSAVRIAGREFVQRTAVSKDLWVLEQEGPSLDWVYRAPRIGERVLMCYSVGDSVEYSSVSRVQSYDSTTFAVAKFQQARPGTSGAVVVSAADGAMLGVYTGEALVSSMCSVFSAVEFGMLSEIDELSESVTPSDVTGGLYRRIEARGLKAVVQGALEAAVPIYSAGQFCGMGISFGGRLYTTIDPNVDQLCVRVNSVDTPVVLDRFDERRYVSRNALSLGLRSDPPFSRSADLNEKVFVLACDDEGPYFSAARRVEHVGASGEIFHVKDFGDSHLPFDGGMIFAERDGAVVGQYVARVDGSSRAPLVKRAMCVGVPKSVSVSAGVQAARVVTDGISARFPFLNVVTWPSNIVDDVFTHSSVRSTTSAMERYAAVGDAAAKLQLFRSMNAIGLAHREWTVGWQALQNNARMSDICHQVGLDKLLRAAPTVVFNRGSKIYADLLEGFLGLVYEFEPADNFAEACRVLGLLYDAATPLATEFNIARSRSASPATATLRRAVSRGRLDDAVDSGSPVISDLETEVSEMRKQMAEILRHVASTSPKPG